MPISLLLFLRSGFLYCRITASAGRRTAALGYSVGCGAADIQISFIAKDVYPKNFKASTDYEHFVFVKLLNDVHVDSDSKVVVVFHLSSFKIINEL